MAKPFQCEFKLHSVAPYSRLGIKVSDQLLIVSFLFEAELGKSATLLFFAQQSACVVLWLSLRFSCSAKLLAQLSYYYIS
jgi:hypothetical protein